MSLIRSQTIIIGFEGFIMAENPNEVRHSREPRARRLRSRETSDPVASQTYFLDHDLCC